MPPNSDKRLFADLFRTRARKIVAIVLLAVLASVLALSILAHHAGPLLRARVIKTLSTRFHGRVDLADLNVSVYQGLTVSGKGVIVYGQTDPSIHLEGVQPLIGVDEFSLSCRRDEPASLSHARRDHLPHISFLKVV